MTSYIIGAIIILIFGFVGGYSLNYFLTKTSHKEQLDVIRNWLIWGVAQAEKELGSGTGELKIREVYNLFVQTFPQAAKWVTYNQFENLVDEALVDLKKILENNDLIEYAINGLDYFDDDKD